MDADEFWKAAFRRLAYSRGRIFACAVVPRADMGKWKQMCKSAVLVRLVVLWMFLQRSISSVSSGGPLFFLYCLIVTLSQLSSLKESVTEVAKRPVGSECSVAIFPRVHAIPTLTLMPTGTELVGVESEEGELPVLHATTTVLHIVGASLTIRKLSFRVVAAVRILLTLLPVFHFLSLSISSLSLAVSLAYVFLFSVSWSTLFSCASEVFWS
jgi:hypothetical protein